MATILLVNHQEITLAGIKALLHQDPKMKIIGEARMGVEALRLAKTLNPQVVLLDMDMPNFEGIEIIRKLLASHSSLKILAIGTEKSIIYPILLLEIGGAG